MGGGGGLAVLWRSSASVSLLGYSNNHIDLLVVEANNFIWRFTGYYGLPDRNRKMESWNLLRALSRQSALPWVCMGDYNDMLCAEEKRGRVLHPNSLFQGFREAVEDCKLTDMPLVGYPFTWERGRGTAEWIQERIDRAMCSDSWFDYFDRAELHNLTCSSSDHSPLLLVTRKHPFHLKHIRFKFDNSWVRELELYQVMTSSWDGLEEWGCWMSFVSALVEYHSGGGVWEEILKWRFVTAIISLMFFDIWMMSILRLSLKIAQTGWLGC